MTMTFLHFIFSNNVIPPSEMLSNLPLTNRCHNSYVVVSQCLTLCGPVDCSPPGSSVGFPRQEYWSGKLIFQSVKCDKNVVVTSDCHKNFQSLLAQGPQLVACAQTGVTDRHRGAGRVKGLWLWLWAASYMLVAEQSWLQVVAHNQRVACPPALPERH